MPAHYFVKFIRRRLHIRACKIVCEYGFRGKIKVQINYLYLSPFRGRSSDKFTEFILKVLQKLPNVK